MFWGEGNIEQDKGNQESWQGEGRFCNLKME